MDSKRKTIIISGGGGYLGNALVRTFTKNGFNIIVLEREIKGLSGTENLHFKLADVSNFYDVKKAADEVKKEFGGIFAIIHAASAPLVRQPALSVSEKDFEKQFAVNVLGGFYLFKYFSEMLSPDGAIIGITTSAIFHGTAHAKSGSYVAAKSGLWGLLRSISFETSFRVYSVAPAFMPDGLNKDLPLAIREFIVKKIGTKNVTDAGEVSLTALSLVNDKERRWSGKTIALPGFLVTEF